MINDDFLFFLYSRFAAFGFWAGDGFHEADDGIIGRVSTLFNIQKKKKCKSY